MQITREALRSAQQKMLQQGFSLAGYARAKGFNQHTFRMWLRGEWGVNCAGPTSAAYLSALKADGFVKGPEGA